jgi:WD40 repeat protein
VALSGDGRLLTSGGGDGVGRLWDTAGAPLGVLEGHHGPVAAVAVSDDGQVVATGGGDGQLKLWHAPGGASLGTLRPERCYERLDITGLTGITAAQRGALLALGAVDRSVPASMA